MILIENHKQTSYNTIMTKIIKKSYSAHSTLKTLNRGAFNDICVLPDLKFETQERKERPILLVREHPLYLITSLLGSLVWIVVAILFNMAIGGVLKGQVSPSLIVRMQTYTILLGFGITISTAIYKFIKWFYNLFLVTNLRIVDLDFYTLGQTSWVEALLANVEDAEVRNVGFIESLFDLGDVYVQTAGHKDKIEILRIPKPMKIQDIILDLAHESKKNG